MALLDVAIVGAGPVGATVAALCAREGLALELFEARARFASDARTLALSQGSRELLEQAGAWPAGATAIETIHISQKGGPGRTVISAAEQRVPALGYTVAFDSLSQALHAQLERAGIPVRLGEACERIALDAGGADLAFASGLEVRARLLVLADGGANARRIPGIAFREKDYGQVAVLGSVKTDRPHGARAYERFTPQGPVALLPVGDRFALILTTTASDAGRLVALDDAAFLAELQAHFGGRAGRFLEIGPRASFPLALRTVNVPIALRTAIIGNAAQALHPIAGQGLNLGLRDAAALAAIVSGTPPASLGGAPMLDEYRRSRERDVARGVAFTDFLVSAFADTRFIPTWGRGLALAVLDTIPAARRALAGRMIHGAAR